jgi:hypothetical protein
MNILAESLNARRNFERAVTYLKADGLLQFALRRSAELDVIVRRLAELSRTTWDDRPRTSRLQAKRLPVTHIGWQSRPAKAKQLAELLRRRHRATDTTKRGQRSQSSDRIFEVTR